MDLSELRCAQITYEPGSLELKAVFCRAAEC